MARFWQVTHAFFEARGDYAQFARTLTGESPRKLGDGAMLNALVCIEKTLYPLKRLVDSSVRRRGRHADADHSDSVALDAHRPRVPCESDARFGPRRGALGGSELGLGVEQDLVEHGRAVDFGRAHRVCVLGAEAFERVWCRIPHPNVQNIVDAVVECAHLRLALDHLGVVLVAVPRALAVAG